MTDGTRTIGDWTLDHEIGRGGMGTVWAARRAGGEGLFALKVLHEHRAESEALVQRFLREADAARRVRHEGVVTIHEIARADDRHFLVMDLVPGRSLDEHLRAVERDPAAAAVIAGDADVVSHRDRRYVLAVARLFAGAARAVAALHDEGVIHRDLKPANLLLHDDGHLVITDFGIARAVDAETMTITGDVLGTPLYLAPERIRNQGRGVDARTDVYSLGVAMYQMLALEAPFRGETLPELVDQIERGAPAPLRERCQWIAAALSAVVDRAISRRPADRYADAHSFADDLEAFVAGRPVRAKGPGRLERTRRHLQRRPALRNALVAVFVVVVLGSAAFAWSRIDASRRLRQRHDDVVAEARHAIDRGAWGSAWRAAQEAERIDSESTEARVLREEIVARASESVAAAAARGGADLLAAAGMSRMVAGFDPTHDAVRRMRTEVGGAIEAEVRNRAGEGDVDDFERLLGGGELPLEESERAGIVEALDGAASKAAAGFDFSRAAAFMTMAARLKRDDATTDGPWMHPGYALLQEIVTGLDSEDSVLRAEALRKLDDPRSWARLPLDETVRFIRATLPGLEGRELVRMIGTVGRRRIAEALPELLDLGRNSTMIRIALLRALARMGDASGAIVVVEGLTGTEAEQDAAISAARRAGTSDVIQRLMEISRSSPPARALAAAVAAAEIEGRFQSTRRSAERETLELIDKTLREAPRGSLLAGRAVIWRGRLLPPSVNRAFRTIPEHGDSRVISEPGVFDPGEDLFTCAAALGLGIAPRKHYGQSATTLGFLVEHAEGAALRACAALAATRIRLVPKRASALGERLEKIERSEPSGVVLTALRLAISELGPASSSARMTALAATIDGGAEPVAAPAILNRLRKIDEFRVYPLDLLGDPHGGAIAICRALDGLAPRDGWKHADRVAAVAEMLRVASDHTMPSRLRGAAWDAVGQFTDSADLSEVSRAVKRVTDPEVMTAAALAAARQSLPVPALRPRAIASGEDAWRASRVEALEGRADAAFEWLERAVTMGFEDVNAVRRAPELAELDAARIEAILAVLK